MDSIDDAEKNTPNRNYVQIRYILPIVNHDWHIMVFLIEH